MRLVAAVVLALVQLAPFAAGGSPPDGASTAPGSPEPAEAGLIEWHPWLQSDRTYWDFAMDPVRDRVLVVGAVQYLGTAELFVLNTTGSLLRIVPLDAYPILAPHLALDRVTGFAYLSSLNAVILKIETATGAVLANWSVPFPVQGLAVRGDRLYAATGSTPLLVLDTSSGAYLGNLSGSPAATYTNLLVDPTGSWLLGTTTTAGTTRIDLATGAATRLSTSLATFADSEDGRVHVCGTRPERSGNFLHAFWPENGSLQPYDVPCRGRVAENPTTGVLADSLGNFLRPTGILGRILFLRSGQFSGFGWRANGGALIGAFGSAIGFEIGAWEGLPRLAYFPAGRDFLNPRYFRFCFYIQSVSGMVPDGIVGTLDRDPGPLPLNLSDSFDCVDIRGIPDGLHFVRVTGTDLLGLPLDDVLPFETDGTAPVLGIAAGPEPTNGTYELQGWANDTHLESVRVNGALASLSGPAWFIRLVLPIGTTTLFVEAVDAVSNRAEANRTVRFWPAHDRQAASPEGHFSVALPPWWTASPSEPSPGGGVLDLASPWEPMGPVLVTVAAEPDPDARADPEYALALARDAQSDLLSRGGVILEPARAGTVAGHPSASVVGGVMGDGIPQVFHRTVVVVPEWGQTILVTARIPLASWPVHSEDVAWILEGLRIDDPSAAAPAPAGVPGPWIGAAIAVVGLTAAAMIVIRRRLRPRDPQTFPPKPG